jgi:hypothetical protein
MRFLPQFETRRNHDVSDRSKSGPQWRQLRHELLEDRRLLSITSATEENTLFTDSNWESTESTQTADAQRQDFAPGEILIGFEGDVVAAYRGKGAGAAI